MGQFGSAMTLRLFHDREGNPCALFTIPLHSTSSSIEGPRYNQGLPSLPFIDQFIQLAL